ncbi:conserved hypothetical protein [Hoeflea sp. EC-HK425]|nr:conserved hypothetical protein [Hoeflea sp. EC-HK425]
MKICCRFLLTILVSLVGYEASWSQEPETPAVIVVLTPSFPDKATQTFIEAFEQKLDEAGITLKSLPSDTLVRRIADIPDFLKSTDTVSMAFMSAEALLQGDNADDFTFSAVTQQPGFVDDVVQNFAIQDSVIGDLVANELSAYGLELISFWSRPPETLWANASISTPSDLEGKKVAQLQGATAEVMRGLGATPVQLPSAELYVALEAGVADVAGGFSSEQWETLGFFDSRTNATLVNNVSHEQGYLVASEQWWIGLSQAGRNDIASAAKFANEAAREVLLIEEAQREQKTLELGIKYTSISDSGWGALRSVSEQNWLSKGNIDAKKVSLETLDSVREEIRLQRERESTLERRGDVEPLVLFATNRNDEKTANLVDRFGIAKTSGNQLTCGVISFKPNHARKIGKPFDGPISLKDDQIWSGTDGCADLLRTSIEPNKHPTIFFHGYSNTFDDAVRRGIGIKRDFGITDPILVWSWPSKGTSGGYVFDLNSVSFSEKYISQFVDSLKRADLLDDVTIIAHSMGSKMAAQLLEKVRLENKKVSNLVFVAPDFPPSLFQQFLADNGDAIQLRTLYANQHDRALWLSESINGETPIGRGGKHLRVVDDIETVDVSKVASAGLINHAHGFDVPKVITDVSVLILERKTASQRDLEQMIADGKPYWSIPPN